MLERALNALYQAPEELGPLSVIRRPAGGLDPHVQVA
jgi:hypothetical protein